MSGGSPLSSGARQMVRSGVARLSTGSTAPGAPGGRDIASWARVVGGWCAGTRRTEPGTWSIDREPSAGGAGAGLCPTRSGPAGVGARFGREATTFDALADAAATTPTAASDAIAPTVAAMSADVDAALVDRVLETDWAASGAGDRCCCEALRRDWAGTGFAVRRGGPPSRRAMARCTTTVAFRNTVSGRCMHANGPRRR